MKKTKGISLIVLIITIVVIIILGTAIVVNLAKTNIIGNANEATVKQDFKAMEEELNMYIADQFAQTQGKLDITTIDASTLDEVKNILKSSSKSKYMKYITIVDGKLAISQDAPDNIKKWASEAIGIMISSDLDDDSNEQDLVITSKDIANNPTLYYGREVEYKISDNNLVATSSLENITLNKDVDAILKNNGVGWEIFYADQDNIYLIANDEIPSELIPNGKNGTAPDIIGAHEVFIDNLLNDYSGNISIDDKVKYLNSKYYDAGYEITDPVLAYMLDINVWNETFKGERAEFVIAGPTLELLLNAYDSKCSKNSDCYADSEWGYTTSIDGQSDEFVEYLKFLKGEVDKVYNDVSIPSPAYFDETHHSFKFDTSGIFARTSEDVMLFRPVICLNSNVKLENVEGTLKIVTIDNSTINGNEPAYNNPVVPKGFEIMETEVATWEDNDEDGCPDGWNEGLVIVDAKGNEFVWVPIDTNCYAYDKKIYVTKDGGSTKAGTWDDYQDGALPNGITNENNQILEYGGFYISRYEAGIPSTSTVPENNVGIPVSKREATVWTNIDYNTAKSSAERMYNSKYVKSSLLTLTAQLTTSEWNESKNFRKWAYATSYGNYNCSIAPANVEGYGKKQTAGYSEYWKINNIYDFYGNVSEMINAYDDTSVISFDGNYDYCMNDTQTLVNSSASGMGMQETRDDYGFRIMLFIK